MLPGLLWNLKKQNWQKYHATLVEFWDYGFGDLIVSLAAVFSIVTQRFSPGGGEGGGALRDDAKNDCEGD